MLLIAVVLIWVAAAILGVALVWAVRNQSHPSKLKSSKVRRGPSVLARVLDAIKNGVAWTKERVYGKPSWFLVSRWAEEILSGSIPEGLEAFTAHPTDCKNCRGRKNPSPRWKVSSLGAHLKKDQLAQALHDQTLCIPCLAALAKVQVKPQSRPKADVVTSAALPKEEKKRGVLQVIGGIIRGFVEVIVFLLFLASLLVSLYFFLGVILTIIHLGSLGLFSAVVLIGGGIVAGSLFGALALFLNRLRAKI